MASLTITVDPEVLRRARRKAVGQGTSVNALMSAYLEAYAGTSGAAQAITEFLDLAAKAGASSGEAGRSWKREELHDRAGLR